MTSCTGHSFDKPGGAREGAGRAQEGAELAVQFFSSFHRISRAYSFGESVALASQLRRVDGATPKSRGTARWSSPTAMTCAREEDQLPSSPRHRVTVPSVAQSDALRATISTFA